MHIKFKKNVVNVEIRSTFLRLTKLYLLLNLAMSHVGKCPGLAFGFYATQVAEEKKDV